MAEGVAQDRVLAYQRAVSQTPRHLGTSDCLPACLALARARGLQRKPCCPRVDMC